MVFYSWCVFLPVLGINTPGCRAVHSRLKPVVEYLESDTREPNYVTFSSPSLGGSSGSFPYPTFTSGLSSLVLDVSASGALPPHPLELHSLVDLPGKKLSYDAISNYLPCRLANRFSTKTPASNSHAPCPRETLAVAGQWLTQHRETFSILSLA